MITQAATQEQSPSDGFTSAEHLARYFKQLKRDEEDQVDACVIPAKF